MPKTLKARECLDEKAPALDRARTKEQSPLENGLGPEAYRGVSRVTLQASFSVASEPTDWKRATTAFDARRTPTPTLRARCVRLPRAVGEAIDDHREQEPAPARVEPWRG